MTVEGEELQPFIESIHPDAPREEIRQRWAEILDALVHGARVLAVASNEYGQLVVYRSEEEVVLPVYTSYESQRQGFPVGDNMEVVTVGFADLLAAVRGVPALAGVLFDPARAALMLPREQMEDMVAFIEANRPV